MIGISTAAVVFASAENQNILTDTMSAIKSLGRGPLKTPEVKSKTKLEMHQKLEWPGNQKSSQPDLGSRSDR